MMTPSRSDRLSPELRASIASGVAASAGAIPLIRVKSMDDVTAVGADLQYRDDFIHHPLYVGQYGKGRVVICSFAAFIPTPRDLQDATQGQFTARCLRWAAKRPVQSARNFRIFVEIAWRRDILLSEVSGRRHAIFGLGRSAGDSGAPRV
jgi:hypothetical protein